MIAIVVIFITLHNCSTMLLPVFLMLCIRSGWLIYYSLQGGLLGVGPCVTDSMGHSPMKPALAISLCMPYSSTHDTGL